MPHHVGCVVLFKCALCTSPGPCCPAFHLFCGAEIRARSAAFGLPRNKTFLFLKVFLASALRRCFFKHHCHNVCQYYPVTLKLFLTWSALFISSKMQITKMSLRDILNGKQGCESLVSVLRKWRRICGLNLSNVTFICRRAAYSYRMMTRNYIHLYLVLQAVFFWKGGWLDRECL